MKKTIRLFIYFIFAIFLIFSTKDTVYAAANVAAVWEVDTKTAELGDEIEFDLRIKNNGTAKSGAFAAEVYLDDCLELKTVTADATDNQFTTSQTGNRVNLQIEALPYETTESSLIVITITATVVKPPLGEKINTSAVVDEVGGSDFHYEGENSITYKNTLNGIINVDKSSMLVDEVATFTITLKNESNNAKEDVTVIATLDSALSVTSKDSTCSATGNSLTCNIAKISAESTKTIIIKAQLNNTTKEKITNNIIIAEADVAIITENPEIIIEESTKKLTLEVSASPKKLEVLDTSNFNIIIKNEGNTTAKNIEVKVVVNSAFSIVDMPNICSKSVSTVICDIDQMSAGETTNMTIKVRLTTPTSSSISSHVTLKEDGETIVSNKAIWNTVTDFQSSKATATFSVNKNTIKTGESLTYTINLDNTGSTSAQDVKVTANIDKALTITSKDSTCSSSGNILTCTVGTMSAGANKKITITAKLNNATTASALTSKVEVTQEGYEKVTKEFTTSIASYEELENVKLSIAHSVEDAKKSYITNDLVTYIVTISNDSTNDIEGILLEYKLNSLLELEKAEGALTSNNNIKWEINSLKANESKTFKLTAKVKKITSNATLENKAILSYNNEIKEAVSKITVSPLNIKFQKSASKQNIEVYTTFEYILYIKNETSSNLNNILVKDVIDESLIVTNDGGGEVSNNIISWTIDLASGEEKTIKYIVKLDKHKNESIKNQAELKHDEDVIKSNELEVKIGVDSPKTGIVIPTITILSFIGILLIIKKYNKKSKVYRI